MSIFIDESCVRAVSWDLVIKDSVKIKFFSANFSGLTALPNFLLNCKNWYF